MTKLKIGDKVVCRHPLIVPRSYKDVPGVVEGFSGEEGYEVRFPDGVLQTTYPEDDGMELYLEGISDTVNSPSHYGQGPIKSDGGPTEYYDFPDGWKTWNDLADYKSKTQWKEHSFHLGNIGKALYRWGEKSGTTKTYDARKIVYSGLRVLLMLEGNKQVQKYLKDLSQDPQFKRLIESEEADD